MVKNRKGQSTLEYIILVTAVIVVIISFLVSPNSPFKNQLNTTLNDTIGMMDTMTVRLGNSLGNIQAGY
jgi:uncharacterized protein (UPF0333 family)